jgi:hypothetical protein
VDSFQEWCHLLECASHQVTTYIDHKNLEYFMTACVLNRRQAYWNILLSWSTASSHIGLESNKDCLMLCLGGQLLRQKKIR